MMLAAAASPTTLQPAPLFGSILLGGFECASQRLSDGRRLDVQGSNRHNRRAADDYRLLQRHGMSGARDGVRWHLVERIPGQYDWSSFLPLLAAAQETGIVPIWDLLHYGVPDHIDVFSATFVDQFAAFAGAVAKLVRDESGVRPVYTPVNEISFWSWAGGAVGGINPFQSGRGPELKRQLVRAALAAIAAIRAIDRRAVIATAEPLIHILPASNVTADVVRAQQHIDAQFEALDMLLGRMSPELGGSERAIDVIGFNYYYNNQWFDKGRTVHLGDWLHRPLRHLLAEVASRYSQPLYIAETGTEGVFRDGWLRYVCDEVRFAHAAGVQIGGICLYPIISDLGWDNDRHCQVRQFDGHDPATERTAYLPMGRALADEIARFEAEPPLSVPHAVSVRRRR